MEKAGVTNSAAAGGPGTCYGVESGDMVHRLGPLIEACEQIAGEGGGETGEDRLCRLYTPSFVLTCPVAMAIRREMG